MMEKTIERILSDHGIEVFGQLPAAEAEMLKPPMEGVRAYIMMLLPYHTAGVERNVALFACFPDYHALTRELLGSVCAELERSFPGETFKATVDSSPIAEVNCAAKCGLGQGEYILKRALGYEPKTVPPDAFFVFHDKLCEILDSPPTPAVEKAALRVFDEIYAQLIDNRKQTTEEITEEIGGDGLSQLSDSGP